MARVGYVRGYIRGYVTGYEKGYVHREKKGYVGGEYAMESITGVSQNGKRF